MSVVHFLLHPCSWGGSGSLREGGLSLSHTKLPWSLWKTGVSAGYVIRGAGLQDLLWKWDFHLFWVHPILTIYTLYVCMYIIYLHKYYYPSKSEINLNHLQKTYECTAVIFQQILGFPTVFQDLFELCEFHFGGDASRPPAPQLVVPSSWSPTGKT